MEEVGIVITEDNGRIIVTPAGGLDLSKVNQNPEVRVPVSIRRNVQYFITLTENGKIFVSPSGEVDLSEVKARASRANSLILSPERNEKLVLSSDGKFEKVSHSRECTPALLQRPNTALLSGSSILTPSGSLTLEPQTPQNAPWCITLMHDTGEIIVTSTSPHDAQVDQWIQLF